MTPQENLEGPHLHQTIVAGGNYDIICHLFNSRSIFNIPRKKDNNNKQKNNQSVKYISIFGTYRANDRALSMGSITITFSPQVTRGTCGLISFL